MAKARPGIIKEKNGKWRVHTKVVVNNTVTYIEKRGFGTEAEAYAFKLFRIEELKNKKLIDPPLFKAILSDYFEYAMVKYKESNIYRLRVTINKYFSKYLNKPIDYICEYSTLNNIIKSIDKSANSVGTKNKILRIFKNILIYSYNRGLLSKESFNNINLLVVPFKDHKHEELIKEKDILSISDYQMFLDCIPIGDKYKVLFTLWGHTGMRIGEIRALQVKHFNLSLKTITISQQAVSKLGIGKTILTSPKSKKSNRVIGISDNICLILTEYISLLSLEANDFIFFARSKDIPLSENAIRIAQKKYSKRANVKYITPHGIRHSYTTWALQMIKNDINQIGLVSERLGHSSQSITLNIYNHINKTNEIDIVNLVNF